MSRRRTEQGRTAGWVLACLLLAGCTRWHYELGAPLVEADFPPPDASWSLHEALATLGPPHRVSATGNGYVLAWEFWRIREDTIGLSLGALGADLIAVDWGSAKVNGEFLLLLFDHKHRLTSSGFSRWSGDVGGGRAIQPLTGLVSLVDVEDLVNDLPHHQWGGTLLDPLPQAINSDSRPDTGQNGIQRRGTPTGIGQRSLE